MLALLSTVGAPHWSLLGSCRTHPRTVVRFFLRGVLWGARASFAIGPRYPFLVIAWLRFRDPQSRHLPHEIDDFISRVLENTQVGRILKLLALVSVFGDKIGDSMLEILDAFVEELKPLLRGYKGLRARVLRRRNLRPSWDNEVLSDRRELRQQTRCTCRFDDRHGAAPWLGEKTRLLLWYAFGCETGEAVAWLKRPTLTPEASGGLNLLQPAAGA